VQNSGGPRNRNGPGDLGVLTPRCRHPGLLGNSLCVLGGNEASGTTRKRTNARYGIQHINTITNVMFLCPDMLHSCRPLRDLQDIVCACPTIYQPMIEIYCRLKLANRYLLKYRRLGHKRLRRWTMSGAEDHLCITLNPTFVAFDLS